ncbi:lysozyme inhibitor LprI family protein [Armatimonas rosea]|uniref:Uncharacterized protein YecT (DUF1311 family) n=1 Tax=Armatimonas rosea TaxID=685828 RepID=A0A7W9SUQ1_ARMRO|nr:uncharacterized protein YecT (DUF1311 family) [Armatimonas rosea]
MSPTQGLAQQPLNSFLEADAARADDELNRVYGLLVAALAKNPKGTTALRSAQRAWLVFRDAEVKAAGEAFGEGTGRRQVEAGTLGRLLQERNAWLLLALAGKSALGSGKERAAADAQLNALWKTHEGTSRGPQRAWLAWRDAEVAFWSVYRGESTKDAVLTRLTWERCRALSGG